MNICLFTEEEIGKPLDARDERAVHLNKVLHKKCGDKFAAGIIGGKAGTAVITKMTEVPNPKTGKNDVQIEYDFTPESDGKMLYPLIMVIGFPRPIQLKRLLRDIAGLGVSRVYLTGTELGEKSYMQSTLVERGAAYQMLLDGTVQAASTHVPELFLETNLASCIDHINADFPDAKKAALDNIRAKLSLENFMNDLLSGTKEKQDLINSTCPIIAAIGSERGWTDRERDLLENEGYKLCSMGKRVLRTETAATVSASIILSKCGFLD